MTIQTDLQSLTPGSIVEMYELDTGAYGLGEMLFSPFVNELGQDIVWQGRTYLRFPIIVEGYRKSSRGTLPRPTMTIANLGEGSLSVILKMYGDFLGAKVTRKRTLVKYLDAANFKPIPPSLVGVNDYADPFSHFPDEVYYIDRKAAENPTSITLELAVAWDVTGVKLPLRQIIRDTCQWVYRGDGCDYNGVAMFTKDDVMTTSPGEDKCSKTMKGCKLRFGDNGQIPGSFCPSVGLIG